MSRFGRWLDRRSQGTRLAILGAAVAGLGGGAYQINEYVAAERHLGAARSAVERDDLPAAKDHLLACAERRPNSGEVNFELARVCRRLEEFAAARRYLKRAEELDWPRNAIASEQALYRAQTGNFREVEGKILEWAREAPNPSDRKLCLEVLIPNYLQRNELQRALSLLRPWTQDEPTNVRAQMWLAEAAERLQMQDVAVAAAVAAAAAAPERLDVRLKCGQLLIDNRRAETARPHFEAVLAREPGHPAATVGLARCVAALGDLPAAVALLEPFLARHPNDPDLLGLRGALALQADRPAEAVSFLERAVKSAPFEAELLYNMALALERLGRSEESKSYRDRHAAAIKDFDELCQVARDVGADPRNAELRYKAGVILHRNGHPQIAAQWFRSALEENPNHEPSRKALSEVRSGPR
jgi:Flp pilus assembly protein TadD